MGQLLHIQSSPRQGRSYSGQVAAAFLEAYRQAHPADTVKTLDVFAMKVPAFDGPAVNAKYAILHGQPHTDDDKKVWRKVESVIAEFKAADKYLVSVPMWNFGIPYRFKHYLDVIVQPGYTFSFTPAEGYKGLVTGKPLLIVAARGGEYAAPPMNAYDFQLKYLETIFGFMGFQGIRTLAVEPTLAGGPEVAAQKRDAAMAQARALAAAF